jgi:predicted metalloprotease
VGDDRLQKEARGYAVPEWFTHGTGAQRARWFRLGVEAGDLNRGETFSANPL